MKKLDTFQKALSTLDSRVLALQRTAKQLTTARHMEAPKINQLMKQVGFCRISDYFALKRFFLCQVSSTRCLFLG